MIHERIHERIEFKVLLTTYKALNGQSPAYISELIRYSSTGGSRNPCLYQYVAKTSMGDRAFISSAARLWNQLPEEIRLSPSLFCFKSNLKTHLFTKSYGSED